MLCRAYRYGLMAGGQRGVSRVLEVLHAGAVRTLHLMGAADMDDVRGRRAPVRLRLSRRRLVVRLAALGMAAWGHVSAAPSARLGLNC